MTKHNDKTQLNDLKELFKAQIIQEKITKITDIPFSYMDLDGKWVGKPSNPNISVLKLINANEVGREKCLECDRKHKDIAIDSRKAITYVSQTGLTNFVVPIRLNGRDMGVIIGGQVLLNDIDDAMRETFKGVAKDLQVDESEILLAANEIQIKKKSDLDNAIKIIKEMVPLICELELEKIEEKRNRIKKDEQITSLQKVGVAITSNLDLHQVLEKIVKSAKEVLNADVTTMYLYNQETNMFSYPPLTYGNLFEEKSMNTSIRSKDVLYKILQLGDSHYSNDAVNDRIMYNNIKKDNSFVVREKIIASAGLPLRISDKTVGILFVNYRTPHQFNHDERKMAKIFANQAAIAIENAKMYERTQKKLKEETEKLNILYEVGEGFHSTLEKERILKMVLEKGVELTGAHKGTARLFDSEHNKLRPFVRKGNFSAKSLKTIKIGDGIIGTSAKEKKSILVPNVAEDGRYLSFNKETKSALAIPMLWGEKKELIGVLNFEHLEINAFSEEDRKLLEALAYTVTIAVNNVDLYEKRAEDQKILLDQTIEDSKEVIYIIQELEKYMNSDEFNLSGLLRKTRDKIVKLVGAKHGCILGRDEEGKLTNLLLCKRISCAADCKERMTNMMINDAFEDRNIVDCPNIEKDKRYNLESRWPDAISNLVIPVPDEHGGVTCILNLSSGVPDAFHSREIMLAKKFAELTAILVNYARRMMKLNERDRWLTLLFGVIFDSKNNPTEKDAVFKHIVELTSDTFHVDECSLFMLDEDSNKITLRTSLNLQNEGVDQALSYEIGEGVTGTIVHTGELIRTRNIQEHLKYSGKYTAYMQKIKPNWECHSFLGVPLRINNRCVGVIKLYNRMKTDDHPYSWFSKEDEDLLSALGDIIGFVIDKARIVNENEAITKRLHQAEKMAAIGSLTAGTTHGLKHPIQTIVNQVEKLRGKEELKPYIDKINIIGDQIYQMHDIVEVFSRFLNPSIEQNRDVKILLNQTLEMMVLPGNININKEDIQAHNLNCDPGQIKQVFQNLILNGCEAMPDGGTLKISAFTNKETISITFDDEGEGVSDYAIEKVFDPFFTTKKSKGTGLGLYISKFIVQNHKGNIFLKSGEGKGSIFVVELPTSNHGQWE
ncbi:MAG: GAF domain-containing protein [Planctomycetes bacterium]|nr:GAF domain-containing protein [Planctomycetota bacterium]